MLIIIDGPKGAGKSTLATELVDRLNQRGTHAIYHKHLRDNVDEIANMQGFIDRALEDEHVVWVADRLHLTEWVMSMVTGRNITAALTTQIRHIAQTLASHEVPMVVLLPSLEHLKVRLSRREDPVRQIVDMDWGAITPIWRAAASLVRGVEIYPNETEDQLDALIEQLIEMVVPFNVITSS
jgi:adenylate kinase family enzyme